MTKVMCILPYKDIELHEVVKVMDCFGKLHIKRLKGLKFNFNITLEQFQKHFMPLYYFYSVPKPPVKKRFKKPVIEYATVYFFGMSDNLALELNKRIFYYLEIIKQINPDILQTFNFSIVSTLEKLELLFKTLPEPQFAEAIKDAEQVFKEIYETMLSIEEKQIPAEDNYQQLLDKFKQDNQILRQFFKELNNKKD